MKYLLTIVFSSLIMACSSNKNLSQSALASKTLSTCPTDGVCTFEVLKNKTFRVKKDEFGNSYSELLEGNKTVLKFEYKRNTPPDLQDASYSELIYIEIENNIEALSIKDSKLGKSNIGFSRLCFCRGQTGTYPITSGDLAISKISKNTFQLNFNFQVSEVPQIITSINETFKL